MIFLHHERFMNQYRSKEGEDIPADFEDVEGNSKDHVDQGDNIGGWQNSNNDENANYN